MTAEGIEKIRGNSAGGAVEDKRKLGLRDGIAHEEPAGTAPRNYFLNRVLGTFELSGSCRRRALTFGSGIFWSGVLPRQAPTSSAEASEEASCILRIAG